MSTRPTPTHEPKHGLYLANSPGYCGELATPSNLVEYAVAAEEAGWDGVFMADAIGNEQAERFIDPWTTLSGIATQTERIRLGTWISPVPRRQPWQLAHELATLDELSDGRVILGAGLGAQHNYDAVGMEDTMAERGDRYDEALEVIVGLWEGEPYSYDGDYYTIDELQLPVTPVQTPRIPILMGCWWPNKKPFHRAAKWDGIMPAAPSFWGGKGVQGEPVTGTPAEEIRDITAYYRGVTDEPGEVLVPIDVPEAGPGFQDVCLENGATWLLTVSAIGSDSHEQNLETIREGPPR